MIVSEYFPTECSQHIFSYLEIAECLSLGTTSSTVLRKVLPDLCVRRHRMTQRYAMVSGNDQFALCPSPTSTRLHPEDCWWHPRNPRAGLEKDFKLESSQSQAFVFPTVQDRVEQLSLKIPLLHPLHGLVQDLCQSLRFDVEKELLAILPVCLSNATLIHALKQIVRPLKLYATILKTALHNGPDKGSTELFQYIGDVLCVAYLMHDCNSKCSFAEGSPSPFVLAEKIRKSPPSCYRSWVLMHASILRTKQFSDNARLRLGIGPSESLTPEIEDVFNAITPRAMAQMYSRSAAAWSMPMDCYRTEAFMASEMVLIYDDFGPLGPSFRGRDIVQVREVSAHSMLACFTTSNVATDGHEALEWLCVAHEQSFKTRPMSVRTPVLRFG